MMYQGRKYAEAVLEAVIPNGVEDLGGSIGFDVIASSHHDQPSRSNADAE